MMSVVTADDADRGKYISLKHVPSGIDAMAT